MAISSTTSTDWPQQIDETRGTIASNNSRGMMEKTSQDHQQAQQTLKCPRCDSSNTKFCYYNNYSLSQPRHFCKACKRYWTRGGTLRNVPVGGGYRKNKRVIKKPAAAVITTASSNPRVQTNLPSTHNHQMNVSSGSNQMNPLFYGLPNTTSYMNHLPFSSSYTSPYDHQSQLGNMGLNYSTSDSNNYGSAGFNPSSTDQVQDLINSSNSQLSSSRFSLFGSSCSTLNMTNDPKSTSYLQGLLPFQDLQMGVSNEDNKTRMVMNKEMKMEEGNNNQIDGDKSTSKVVEWNLPSQNMVGSTDSTMYWNSNMSVGAWPDLTNTYGSSVTSLI